MKPASKLSALVQRFGIGDAFKSWFGLFNLFFEANQIVVAENLHASAFSDIATLRELLRRQLQLIASSHSSILSSGTLEVIQSPKSATKQKRRHAHRRKRSACGPPAVEPRSITSTCSSFTDCKSDSLVYIDSVVAINSNCKTVGVMQKENLLNLALFLLNFCI